MTPNDAPGLIADANILLRLAHPPDPLHGVAVAAIARLAWDDVPLYIAPQTVYEFWAVATRPSAARGGLGWTPAQADIEAARFETLFELLPETPDVYSQWRRLCRVYGVSGLSAHDARLVALWLVHRGAHDLAGILTFNTTDFARYTPAPPQGEGIAVVDPASVTA
jgi:predicted nucleic acid-binding protein